MGGKGWEGREEWEAAFLLASALRCGDKGFSRLTPEATSSVTKVEPRLGPEGPVSIQEEIPEPRAVPASMWRVASLLRVVRGPEAKAHE